jgi:hypothetical protein
VACKAKQKTADNQQDTEPAPAATASTPRPGAQLLDRSGRRQRRTAPVTSQRLPWARSTRVTNLASSQRL